MIVQGVSPPMETIMKRRWQVRRTTVAQEDGQRRWDRAYRSLLEWGLRRSASPDQGVSPFVKEEEADDTSGVVCPSLDVTAATGADDRATD